MHTSELSDDFSDQFCPAGWRISWKKKVTENEITVRFVHTTHIIYAQRNSLVHCMRYHPQWDDKFAQYSLFHSKNTHTILHNHYHGQITRHWLCKVVYQGNVHAPDHERPRRFLGAGVMGALVFVAAGLIRTFLSLEGVITSSWFVLLSSRARGRGPPTLLNFWKRSVNNNFYVKMWTERLTTSYFSFSSSFARSSRASFSCATVSE